MDRGSAPPPSYQPASFTSSTLPIPDDIIQPLFVIAQLHSQYNAEDVAQYYRVLLQHLGLGTQNVEVAYVPDQKISVEPTPEPQLLSIATGVYGDHISPKTVPTIEDGSFETSYEVDRSEQLHITPSPRQRYPSLADELTPPPAPSPAASFHTDYQQQPNFSSQNISPATPFTPQPYQQNQWLQIPQFTTQPYQQPHYAPAAPSPYYNNPAPQYLQSYGPLQLCQPESNCEPQNSFSFLSSLGRELRTSHGLYPLIDVVPSRTRGRGIRKGVRKVITRAGVMGVGA